jgi:hypothetical protein
VWALPLGQDATICKCEHGCIAGDFVETGSGVDNTEKRTLTEKYLSVWGNNK